MRVCKLDSDAFPGLSWSSALLTDEGFYIHNARNLVLFRVTRTDQFNNMLIMPTLHALQVIVFHIWGVGATQARMITVILSVAALPLFYFAVDRSLGRRTAITATVFLAFDHVFFLYNRLALMDSPAASVLIIVLYLWVIGVLNTGWRRNVLLYLCGLSLVVAYTMRGLTAPIFIAPIAAIWFTSVPDSTQQDSGRKKRRIYHFIFEASPVTCGLLSGLVVYLAVWYFPNRLELARVNHYYLGQLMPGSISGCAKDAVGAVFGNARGMTAYLIRHSSVGFVLPVAWIMACLFDLLREENRAPETITQPNASGYSEAKTPISKIGKSTLLLAAVWFLILWFVLVFTRYSPSRYYVLGYPAMAILCGHALWDLPALVRALFAKPLAAASLLGLTAYHVTLVAVERCFPFGSDGPIRTASIAALVVGLTPILAVRTVV